MRAPIGPRLIGVSGGEDTPEAGRSEDHFSAIFEHDGVSPPSGATFAEARPKEWVPYDARSCVQTVRPRVSLR